MARDKSINELLGGTGTSPVSTVFNAVRQYQSLMEGIEDRSWKQEARRLNVAQSQIDAVKGFVGTAKSSIETGDTDAAKSALDSYDDALPKMNDLGVYSHRVQMENLDNNVESMRAQVQVLEEADTMFDQVLSEDSSIATLHFDNLSHSDLGKGDALKLIEKGVQDVSLHLENVKSKGYDANSKIVKDGTKAINRLLTYKTWIGNDEKLTGVHTRQYYNDYRAGIKGDMSSPDALRATNQKFLKQYRTRINQAKNRMNKYLYLRDRMQDDKSGDPMATWNLVTTEGNLSEAYDIEVDNVMNPNASPSDQLNSQLAWITEKIQQEEQILQIEGDNLRAMTGDSQYLDVSYEDFFSDPEDIDVDLKNLFTKIKDYKEKGYGLEYDINMDKLDGNGMPTKSNGLSWSMTELMGLEEALDDGYNTFNQEKIRKEKAEKEKKIQESLGAENIEWLDALKKDYNIKVDKSTVKGEDLKSFKKNWLDTHDEYEKVSEIFAKGDKVLEEFDQYKVDLNRFDKIDWNEPENRARLEKWKNLLGAKGEITSRSKLQGLDRKYFNQKMKEVIKQMKPEHFGVKSKFFMPQSLKTVLPKWEASRQKIEQLKKNELKNLIKDLEMKASK